MEFADSANLLVGINHTPAYYCFGDQRAADARFLSAKAPTGGERPPQLAK